MTYEQIGKAIEEAKKKRTGLGLFSWLCGYLSINKTSFRSITDHRATVIVIGHESIKDMPKNHYCGILFTDRFKEVSLSIYDLRSVGEVST
jgi:hypothetical protein